MSLLSQPYFHDEDAAYAHIESVIWPKGPICPHCGNVDGERIYRLKGKTHRRGLRKCAECRKQFTVKIGTVFESSHVPLYKWLQAIYLMVSSKKGISANQLHRTLEVTHKTACFIGRRIREAMRDDGLTSFGSGGTTVEIGETFLDRKKGEQVRHGYEHKIKVLSLAERETGRAYFMAVDKLNSKTVSGVVRENVARETHLQPLPCRVRFPIWQPFGPCR